MTELAHQTIAALRTGHEELATRVRAMTPEELAAGSGASAWDVSGVLSHLGSGAEIGLATWQSQLATSGAPAPPDNQEVWDRWNAMGAEERARSCVEADAALVAAYEDIDDEQLRDVRIELGFLPHPVDLPELAAMRLSEQALHGWDVKVASDATAVLQREAVPLLIDRSGVLIGFIGKAGALRNRPVSIAVTTTDPARSFGLLVGDEVALGETPDVADGTLELPAEAWLRLVAGRLGPAHTPEGVHASGAVTVDELRQLFPGY